MEEGDLLSFEEVPAGVPQKCGAKDSSVLEESVALQPLLLQFSHPKVRGDFLHGEFSSYSENPQWALQKLDMIRVAVMPQWHGSETVVRQRTKSAAKHITSIIQKSEEMCALNPSVDDRWTYAEWNTFLSNIATSKYWGNTPFINRCVHYLPDTSQDPVANSRHIKKEKSLFGRRCDENSSDEEMSAPGRRQSRRKSTSGIGKRLGRLRKSDTSEEAETDVNEHQARSRSSPLVKMEEIVLTDSDDAAEESLLDWPLTDTVATSSKPRSYRRVVKPQPFEMDGRQHLKSFLEVYEHYFEREYAGTSRECTQELRRYLKGELREIYDILGGRELLFPDMKSELLRWYKEERVGGRQYWREQLKMAHPKPNESLHLYGLRLKDLASRAYPTDKVEGARQLRSTFLNTAPDEFADEVSQVEQYQRIMQRQSGSKAERLTWVSIMDLARQYDKKQNVAGKSEQPVSSTPDKLVWFNHAPEHDSVEKLQMEGACTGGPGKKTNKMASQIYSSTRTIPVCYWCGKKGHIEVNCRKKKGLCLICGGVHQLKDCPNYKATQKVQLRCSTCHGDHLGQDCSKKPEN